MIQEPANAAVHIAPSVLVSAAERRLESGVAVEKQRSFAIQDCSGIADGEKRFEAAWRRRGGFGPAIDYRINNGPNSVFKRFLKHVALDDLVACLSKDGRGFAEVLEAKFNGWAIADKSIIHLRTVGVPDRRLQRLLQVTLLDDGMKVRTLRVDQRLGIEPGRLSVEPCSLGGYARDLVRRTQMANLDNGSRAQNASEDRQNESVEGNSVSGRPVPEQFKWIVVGGFLLALLGSLAVFWQIGWLQ